MRQASLHITEDNLVKLLDEFYGNPKKSESDKLAKFLLARGKRYSLSHRMVYVSNDKLLKKAAKLKVTNQSDAGLFAQLLVLQRRALKHRGIMQLSPGDQDWWTLKEITQQATEFCSEFGIGQKEGYKEYIKIGLGMMKNYSISKFKQLHSAIVNRFEAMVELMEDKNSQQTEVAYLTYTKIMNERTGMLIEDYKNIPEKLVCFKRAKDDALRLNIPVKLFISAQFEAMALQNRIPDPLQLYGDKAIGRVRKYCAENQIKVTPEKSINFKAIKNAAATNR